MSKSIAEVRRFVGLDVHAQTIAVAVAEKDEEVRNLGIIPNRLQSIRKLLPKLGQPGTWRACYEAGPTGYTLYWQLHQVGVDCIVVAPTLVPMKAGDRVKTDRRDAERLARSLRAGELTSVWVPDAAHEALRDLVRAREAAKQDQLRARHRLAKFLLRHGRRPSPGVNAWTQRYLDWIRRDVTFDHFAQRATLEDYLAEVDHQAQRIVRLDRAIDEAITEAPASTRREVVSALQALRGIRKLIAVTIVAELGQLSRFPSARQLMGYSGAVSSEHSSGQHTWRGRITKTGNAHWRRVLVEAAWSQRYGPTMSRTSARQKDLTPAVQEIASKALHRLSARYRRLSARGKPQQQVVTAIARELLGFIWAIGVEVERNGCSDCVAA